MTPLPQERLVAFRSRCSQYLSHGHDRLAAARFVVDAAMELSGPALDIGTGKGLLAIELARRGLEVVTIDVDEQERELARLLASAAGVAGRICFDTADAAGLPYADGSFGTVAMMDVLHHLEDSDRVLREMARVVVPGGIALIADFDERGFEIVSNVLREEGREHSRTSVTVSSVLEGMGALGFGELSRVRGHQHEIAVLRRKERTEA